MLKSLFRALFYFVFFLLEMKKNFTPGPINDHLMTSDIRLLNTVEELLVLLTTAPQKIFQLKHVLSTRGIMSSNCSSHLSSTTSTINSNQHIQQLQDTPHYDNPPPINSSIIVVLLLSCLFLFSECNSFFHQLYLYRRDTKPKILTHPPALYMDTSKLKPSGTSRSSIICLQCLGEGALHKQTLPRQSLHLNVRKHFSWLYWQLGASVGPKILPVHNGSSRIKTHGISILQGFGQFGTPVHPYIHPSDSAYHDAIEGQPNTHIVSPLSLNFALHCCYYHLLHGSLPFLPCIDGECESSFLHTNSQDSRSSLIPQVELSLSPTSSRLSLFKSSFDLINWSVIPHQLGEKTHNLSSPPASLNMLLIFFLSCRLTLIMSSSGMLVSFFHQICSCSSLRNKLLFVQMCAHCLHCGSGGSGISSL
ncbi:putative signal peptide protein [Puccinia sorghi]|uniref:Putative signal peptide protein n=1 Tax=Puccinia sorghi TaxID=27349 RepID=A0A0L6V563_9BASI|nr:putative signal peptide protein [Puccinia sorghi]